MISKRRHWADDVYDLATWTRISTKHKSGNKMKEKKIVIKKMLTLILETTFLFEFTLSLPYYPYHA